MYLLPVDLESNFHSRYLPPDLLFEGLHSFAALEVIGSSVQQRPIYAARLGTGATKILAWSQMHGNESTTTRALIDFFTRVREDRTILETFRFILIFQLNPDGAYAYTRHNANHVDLNRDALDQTQPETQAFMRVLNEFSPDLCLNLHDQRTRFSVGETGHEAALSFLAPAADEQRSHTDSRLRSMALIGAVVKRFPHAVQLKIARFNDAFNVNCFGDYLAQLGVPTILIEAGQWGTDYDRVITRRLVFESLVSMVREWPYLSVNDLNLTQYFEVLENTEYAYDEGGVDPNDGQLKGFRYKERLEAGQIHYDLDEHHVISSENRYKVCFRSTYTVRDKENKNATG
ncbi:MAG: hypothetical protein RLZZ242_89 [Bacteroidota bacterium]